METMAFIRFLTDGDLGHDLANPFKTAFMQCPECDGTMLIDRDKWRADCMKCSHFEYDVPDMIVARSDLNRDEACAAFELSKTTDVFPLSSSPSFEKLEYMAAFIKCTMTEVNQAHAELLNSPLLKEVLLLRNDLSESDIISGLTGSIIRDGTGLFLFPKIKMNSLVEHIDIVSIADPEYVWHKFRCCDTPERLIY